MSETEEKKDKDIAAEKKPAPADTPVKKTARRKHAKKHSPLTLIIIVVLLVVTGASYTLWQSNQKQQGDTLKKFGNINEQLDKLKRAQRYQSDDQQEQINELDEKQQELKRSFASLLKTSTHMKNDWLLAEAEYLVKLANHRLILEKDITTAITALEAADERLKEVADPALLEIRKIVLEQAQSLRAIEQADITGMALQISALIKEIPALPMQTPDPATVQQRKQTQSSASQIKDWHELPGAIWEDIKRLVIIRDHTQAVQPLIPPEQHYFLIQNLNLQLEQARMALLKANNALYADSLSTAKQWINHYFDVGQQSTQSILDSINTLAAKNIEPVIPDISRSFKVIQQYRMKGFVPAAPEKAEPVKAAPDKKEPAEKTQPAPAEKAAQNGESKTEAKP